MKSSYYQVIHENTVEGSILHFGALKRQFEALVRKAGEKGGQ